MRLIVISVLSTDNDSNGESAQNADGITAGVSSTGMGRNNGRKDEHLFGTVNRRPQNTLAVTSGRQFISERREKSTRMRRLLCSFYVIGESGRLRDR